MTTYKKQPKYLNPSSVTSLWLAEHCFELAEKIKTYPTLHHGSKEYVWSWQYLFLAAEAGEI